MFAWWTNPFVNAPFAPQLGAEKHVMNYNTLPRRVYRRIGIRLLMWDPGNVFRRVRAPHCHTTVPLNSDGSTMRWTPNTTAAGPAPWKNIISVRLFLRSRVTTEAVDHVSKFFVLKTNLDRFLSWLKSCVRGEAWRTG